MSRRKSALTLCGPSGGTPIERLAAGTVSGGERPPARIGRPGTSTERDSITTEELRSLAPSKYGAKRTHVPALDRTFASKHEATVAVGLALRQELGEIRDLRFQPRYRLDVDGTVVGHYVADFEWFVWNAELGCLDQVVADAKGYATPVYRLKKRLMKAIYGIDVVEL